MRIGAVDFRQGEIFPLKEILKMSAHFIGIKKFSRKYRLLLILVRIKRRYALFCGTVFLVGKSQFFKSVKFPVPGKKKRSPVADFQIVRGDAYSFGSQIFHLSPEILRVKRNSVSQDI